MEHAWRGRGLPGNDRPTCRCPLLSVMGQRLTDNRESALLQVLAELGTRHAVTGACSDGEFDDRFVDFVLDLAHEMERGKPGRRRLPSCDSPGCVRHLHTASLDGCHVHAMLTFVDELARMVRDIDRQIGSFLWLLSGLLNSYRTRGPEWVSRMALGMGLTPVEVKVLDEASRLWSKRLQPLADLLASPHQFLQSVLAELVEADVNLADEAALAQLIQGVERFAAGA